MSNPSNSEQALLTPANVVTMVRTLLVPVFVVAFILRGLNIFLHGLMQNYGSPGLVLLFLLSYLVPMRWMVI